MDEALGVISLPPQGADNLLLEALSASGCRHNLPEALWSTGLEELTYVLPGSGVLACKDSAF